MKLGFVGNGVVGSALARAYLGWHDVRVWDLDEKRCTHELPQVMESDLVFVCLPTPAAPWQGPAGTPAGPADRGTFGLDLSAVDGFLAGVCSKTLPYGQAALHVPWVFVSTMPVGGTRWLAGRHGLRSVVHSPEFLTARCSYSDTLLSPRRIVGGPECASRERLVRLYRERFPGSPVHSMSWEEAEAVKLVTNAFYAVKVSFFNEAKSLCAAADLDWDTVRLAVLAGGTISQTHTQVPGPDGKEGFGGACLPKDLRALAHALEVRLGADAAPICRAALARNVEDRRLPVPRRVL